DGGHPMIHFIRPRFGLAAALVAALAPSCPATVVGLEARPVPWRAGQILGVRALEDLEGGPEATSFDWYGKAYVAGTLIDYWDYPPAASIVYVAGSTCCTIQIGLTAGYTGTSGGKPPDTTVSITVACLPPDALELLADITAPVPYNGG